MKEKVYKFETLQLHAGQEEPDSATDARAVPIYATTSYVFKDSEQAAQRFALREGGNIYSRLMNPTSDVFEQRMAALENGAAALATASGSAAIDYAIRNIVTCGDHIVSSSTVYGGTYNLFANTLTDSGITTSFVDGSDPKNFEEAIQDNTKAVYLESLGNPNADIIDLEAVSEIAHRHGIPVIVDNTFATPFLFRPLEHGADIVVHSATKYLSGHNDLLGGILVCKDQQLAQQYFEYYITTGDTLDSFDSWLLLRSLKTLNIRVKQHTKNAQEVVKYLKQDPRIEQVLYPGKGGMISFYLKNEADVAKLLDNVKLITFAESLGGIESLITIPYYQTHADVELDQRQRLGITPRLLRLSVGLEDPADVIADIQQALG